MSISAFIPVYNEEGRIETALKNLQWCDEIILIDKQSTDRTREIAKLHNAQVFVMPNTKEYNTTELDFMVEHCRSEWVFIFTASDVIHPKLAHEIKRLTSLENFDQDVIHVPYRRFVLGIETKNSPWYSSHAPMVYRKSIVKINKTGVHNAVQFESNRHYKIKNHVEHSVFHLTHSTVDMMMDRHLRYWRGEAISGDEEKMSKSFFSALKSIYTVFLLRRSFLLGWNGVMLGFAYISYFMMAFVYKWERKYSNASQVYESIKENIAQEWKEKG